MALLDPLRTWTTLVNMDGNEGQPPEGALHHSTSTPGPATSGSTNGEASLPRLHPSVEPYDPHTVLCCLAEAVRPTPKGQLHLDRRLFISRNGMAFAFAATSHRDGHIRGLGYAVLAGFHRHLMRWSPPDGDSSSRARNEEKKRFLTGDDFNERTLYLFAEQFFRDSLPEPNYRVPHVVAHFFARLSKLMLSPGDACFAPLMSFLALKPQLRMDTVPEFLKMFFSSSTENHKAERQWVLKLCVESTLEPKDYQTLCRV